MCVGGVRVCGRSALRSSAQARTHACMRAHTHGRSCCVHMHACLLAFIHTHNLGSVRVSESSFRALPCCCARALGVRMYACMQTPALPLCMHAGLMQARRVLHLRQEQPLAAVGTSPEAMHNAGCCAAAGSLQVPCTPHWSSAAYNALKGCTHPARLLPACQGCVPVGVCKHPGSRTPKACWLGAHSKLRSTCPPIHARRRWPWVDVRQPTHPPPRTQHLPARQPPALA